MKHSKLFVLSFLLVVFIVSTPNVFAQTQFYHPCPWGPGDMNIIVRSRTLDEEQLVEGDEIGVFSQIDLCIGASVVVSVWDPENPEATMLGISCPPDEPLTDEIDGFRSGVDTEM